MCWSNSAGPCVSQLFPGNRRSGSHQIIFSKENLRFWQSTKLSGFTRYPFLTYFSSLVEEKTIRLKTSISLLQKSCHWAPWRFQVCFHPHCIVPCKATMDFIPRWISPPICISQGRNVWLSRQISVASWQRERRPALRKRWLSKCKKPTVASSVLFFLFSHTK